MLNHSQSEKTKENKLLNPKSGTNSNRRLMTPSIKNISLAPINSNPTFSKEKKLITSSVKFSTNLQQKENVNKFQNSTSNILHYPSKRKFTEIQKEKEVAKTQISEVLKELDSLYDSKSDQFQAQFKEILDKENSINYSRLVPVSLNTKGSCLLEHSKFYISLMRFKSLTHTDATGLSSEYRLDDFIAMMDNCLMYDQDDLNLLYSFFIDILSKYYSREEIFIRLQKKEANYMVLNGISNLEDLKEIHLKYILAKPESFLKFELESSVALKESYQSQPNSSKKKKVNNSIRDRLEKSPVFKNLLFTGSKKVIIESIEGIGEIDEKKSKSSCVEIKEIHLKEDNMISEGVKQVDLHNGHIDAEENIISEGVKQVERQEVNLDDEDNMISEGVKLVDLQEGTIETISLIKEELVINEVEKEATPSIKTMSQASNSKHSLHLLSTNKSKINQSPRPSIATSRKSVYNQSSNNSSSKLPERQVNLMEEESNKKSVATSNKKEVRVNINIEPETQLQFDLNNIEPFANSTSKIKLNLVSTLSPISQLLETKPETNPLTDSNPVTNTNFSVQMSNLPNYFAELNMTSFSSSFLSTALRGNLSSDAQILYQEIILRNKIDLEIEKESIQFKGHVKKQPKRKNYKVESLEKFSLLPEEKVIKEEVAKENVSNDREKKSNISKRVSRNKSKSLIKVKREEEEEEKNAEDIDVHKTEDEEDDAESKKGNKKRTKNLKNKKKYQSDVKADKIAYVSSDEKESIAKKKKNKKEESKKAESKEEIKRGRNSSIVEIPKEKSKKEKNKRSSSISDKESENDEKPSHSKNRTKKKEKKDRRSKSTTRGKKK